MENIVDEFENWDYSVINLPRIKEDFSEYNIYTVYNEEHDNYDIMSKKPDYKGEEYKIITCDKNGISKNEESYDIDLKLTDPDNYNFYNYVSTLQTLKSDEKYKDFGVSYHGETIEIDFNNDEFNRKLIINDSWDGFGNVEEKLVLEQYGDADIDVYNKCIGAIYSNELYQNSKEGKLGTYYILKNHSDENNLYNLYYLADQQSYVNIGRYIDNLIEDMDEISDMSEVVTKRKEIEFVDILKEEGFDKYLVGNVEKKELIDYNINDVKDKTENEMKYRGDIMARAGNIFNQNKDVVDLDDMRENINNTKMTGNINKNQELFRQALGMDNIDSSTSNVRYIDGDFDGDYKPFGVSPEITEEEFVDIMNQLNDSINKNNELEL